MALILTLSLFIVSQPVVAQEGEEPPVESVGAFVPGEVVVRFSPGLKANQYAAQASALAGEVSAQVVGQYEHLALLSFAEEADVEALAGAVSGMAGVEYAGPNYVYSIPELADVGERPEESSKITQRLGPDGETRTIEVDALRAMRSNGKALTYPSDPALWWNWGYDELEAEIVWKNKTKGFGVCVLDTGVDYNHKDLKGAAVKGYDFVNNDNNPMDDHGHGTHVAGVIAAKVNNKEGIAGISNGKVIAVKVLNAQGYGTSFNIASGMWYCGTRSDVGVLNLSLGSTSTDPYMYYGVDDAVNWWGKLVVAAAGNSNTDAPHYPAYYSYSPTYPEFTNKVISVAAEDSPWGNWGCKAGYSNYGSWVSVIAPGSDILSTMPWEVPFYLGYYYGSDDKYDYMSGTSMATPFVAGAAARRWGYMKYDTNAQVGYALKNTGPWYAYGDGSCWPVSMDGKPYINVAALLDRGGAYGSLYDSTTGLPMPKSKITIWQNGVKKGQGQTDYWFTAYADVLDLPGGPNYFATANIPNYTVGDQPVFLPYGFDYVVPGYWMYVGKGLVPPKTTNWEVVAGWYGYTDMDGDGYDDSIDLDLNLWLPWAPFQDPSQPAHYIVGPEGNDFGMDYGDPTGTLMAFPYAIYNRDSWVDNHWIESISIGSRSKKFPFYQGWYTVGITDYGQTNFYGQSVLWDASMYTFLWQNGTIWAGAWNQWCGPTYHWYFPYQIYSGASSWYIDFIDTCGNAGPYANPYTPQFFSESESGSGVDGDFYIRPTKNTRKNTWE